MKEMSNGEKAIKEILEKYNIDFVFDYPMIVRETKNNDKERLRIWYPDFWLPKYSIGIEYFGLTDKDYIKGKNAKMKTYKEMGVDVIPVYPKTIQKNLRAYLLINIKRLINEKVRHFENRNS